MFNLGGSMGELVLIFVVALLVFGPKRLPELGKSLGRAMHEFKKATNEFKQNLDAEIGAAEIKEELLRQQKEIQDKLAAIGAEATKIETEEAYARPAAIDAGPPKEAAATPAGNTKPEQIEEAQKSYAG